MAGPAETVPSLPYHEPDIVTILIQSSFLLLLNLVNAVLDRLVYCGLLGQVLVGIAWGTPGAKWLSAGTEEVLVQFAYLGLILLVYEGGLLTSFQSLKANLLLSLAVALTGITIPIGLSYTLQGLLNATPLQAFAAGAALCSTSLGTTFTVLASSGLSQSRLGVVLTSAAIMDDVVGLIMVQVISNLGGGSIEVITIVRPILVSIAFAIIVPLACKLAVQPLTLELNSYRKMHPCACISTILQLRQTALIIHTALLLVLVAGSSYAGTSNLFAAYIAGAVISWWDSEVPHPVAGGTTKKTNEKEEDTTLPEQGPATALPEHLMQPGSSTGSGGEVQVQVQSPQQGARTDRRASGTAIYEQYYHQAVARILKPLFFASIGFSIPITRMFNGSVVWRGAVYTILMILGKLVCGLWLVRFSLSPLKDPLHTFLSAVKVPSMPHFWGRSDASNTSAPHTQATTAAPEAHVSVETDTLPSPAPKPFSLHPPLILALAMTARGEIGFLISAVAESKGVFSSPGDASEDSDIFLVVTWAIVLCTILGPLGVGLCVRRVKKLQERKNRGQEGAGRDVLGVWGVE